MAQSQKRKHYPLVIVLSLFVLLMFSLSIFVPGKKEKTSLANVTVFPQPRALEPFQLRFSSEGKTPFDSSNLNRHWTLVFFGFTHCSAICPTTLSLLAKVYTPLHAKQPNFQVLFISIDPTADKTPHLKSYVRRFHPAFMAATGSAAEVKKAEQLFGVFAEKTSDEQFSHSNSLFLINPEGKWLALLPAELPSSELLAKLEALISL